MGETSNQIESRIRETRNDLTGDLSDLRERVKGTVDWRMQVEERPMVMMALAFGGGVLLSALLPSGHTSRKNFRAYTNAVPDPGRAVADSSRTEDGKANQSADMLSALKNALMGAAVTKFSGLVEEVLPGFQQEWGKAEVGKNLNRSGAPASDQPSWQKRSTVGAG